MAYPYQNNVVPDLNAALNKLYHEKVQIDQQEAKKYRELTFTNVEKILEYINSKDKRFSRDPVRAGSYWQGLRIGKADEYDFSIVLKNVPKLYWGGSGRTTVRTYGFNRPVPPDMDTMPADLTVTCFGTATMNRSPNQSTTTSFTQHRSAGFGLSTSSQPAAALVQFPSEPPKGYQFAHHADILTTEQREDIVRDGDIVPFLVLKCLKDLLTRARRDLNLRGEIKQSRKVNKPALTLHFKEGGREMDIDFAPMIRAQLPFKEDFGWPRNGCRWPSQQKIMKIKDAGINLVSKKDFWWLYAFVDAEKELVAEIDIDGGKRKETHRLMKHLNREVWSNVTKPAMTSYILKNVWFWEMEQHPHPSDWTNDKIGARVISMTEAALRGIRDRQIKQYFQPGFNLLQSKDPKQLDIAAEKMTAFLKKPFEKVNELIYKDL